MRPSIKSSTENIKLREEFEVGRSSLEEERELVQYYEYNADNGSLDSLITMGVIYLEVRKLTFLLTRKGGVGGIAQDYKKALQYFEKAAQTEDPSALYHLGFMYINGYGTEVDSFKGVDLLKKASRLGNKLATTKLGELYLSGTHGIEQDVKRAIEYVKRLVCLT